MSGRLEDSGRARQGSGGGSIEAALQGRSMRLAALLLITYAAIQVAVNGVVLDETVIAAQIIAGSVRYDPGHPHAIFYPTAFSLPQYLAAGLWALHSSTELISALRNILFLFMSTFAAFAVSFVLTRRATWGYVAVALVVAEANLRFAGLYPMWTFPYIYSNGHVGLQASVLVGALLIGGMWRSSALLLGLMPGIHVVYALIVWPWAALVMLKRKVLANRSAFRAVLLWGGIGMAVCGAVFLLIRLMADTRPAVAPYDVTSDGALIREQFRIWTDSHRRPVPLLRFGYLPNAIAFAVLSVLLWVRARAAASNQASSEADGGPPGRNVLTGAEPSSMSRWEIASFGGLGALAFGYVFGTRLWQVFAPLPEAVLLTMPSRFSNLPAVLLLPLLAAAIASSTSALDGRKRGLVFGLLALVLLAGGVLAANPLALNTRVIFSRNVFFLLLGLVLGCELASSAARHRSVAALSLLTTAGVLFVYWNSTNVAAYVLGSAIGTAILLRWSDTWKRLGTLFERVDRIGPARLLAPGIVILSLAALPGRTVDPISPQFTRWDMQSDDTRAIGEWLSRNARPDEPVLAPFEPNAELQLKTGQPVLFEHKTLWIMTYMPQISPLIGTMVKDLYGVDYENPEFLATACGGGSVNVYCPVWNEEWQQRNLEQWRTLGEKYRFRLVLASSRVPLKLPAVVSGTRWTLYAFE